MPSRPRSHVVADLAVEQVGAGISQLGWAWERVQQDYGEDILVQPVFDGDVEPFKIWLQVKGTDCIATYRNKDRRSYSYSFSIGHLMKWLRSTDLHILVLWDVKKRRGYFGQPSSAGSAWDLTFKPGESATVRFRAKDRLTKEAWIRIGWQSRLRYYDSRIGRLRALAQDRLGSDSSRVALMQELHLAAFECLAQLEIFDDDMVFCKEFTEDLPKIAANLSGTDPLTDEERADGVTYESMAATLLMISLIAERSGAGCPQNLLVILPDFTLEILSRTDLLQDGSRNGDTS